MRWGKCGEFSPQEWKGKWERNFSLKKKTRIKVFDPYSSIAISTWDELKWDNFVLDVKSFKITQLYNKGKFIISQVEWSFWHVTRQDGAPGAMFSTKRYDIRA